MSKKSVLLVTSGAARALETPEHRVRVYADAGRLPCVRDATGRRLFALSDVLKLKAELAKKSEPEQA
jgi:DNA-binding transcriptional MerR regulator